MIQPHDPNVPRLLAELCALGISYREQARALKVSPSTHHRWTRGSDPGYSATVAILRLHGEHYLRALYANVAVSEAVPEECPVRASASPLAR